MLVLIVRLLGLEGQGVYAFALALWMMSGILTSIGMEVANNFYGAKQQGHPIATLFGNSLVSSFVLGSAGGVILFGLTKTPLFPPEFVPYATFLSLGVPATTVTSLLSGLLMGCSGFLEKLLADVLLYLGCIATVISSAVGGLLETQDLLLYWLIWQVLSTLLVAFALLRLSNFKLSFRLSVLKEQMRYGARAYVYMLSNALTFRFDALVVAYLLGPAALGLYSVAVAATEVLLYVPKALSNVFLTAVSSGKTISVKTYHVILTLLVLMGIVCTIAAFVLFPYVLGPEFSSSAPLVAVLVVGAVGMSMGSLAAFHLFGVGESTLPTRAAVVSAACIVIADLALIPYLGLLGAASAATLAYMVFGLLNLFFLARHTGTKTVDFLRVDIISLYKSLLCASGSFRRWRYGQP